MTEQDVEFGTSDGTVDAVLFRPDGPGPFPGVLYLTDIGGVRPVFREMAARVAALGFAVLLPNVFFRTRRPPMFEFPRNFKEERTRQRFAELTGPLVPAAVERDARSYVEYLATREFVSPGPIAAVGYCFTGTMALRIAAACADRIGAVASFHGGGLCTEAETSPHRLLPRVRARLLIAHADQDGSMPASAIEAFGAALLAWGGRVEHETYAGAAHGWTVPDSPAYDSDAAERAWERLSALLRSELAGRVA